MAVSMSADMVGMTNLVIHTSCAYTEHMCTHTQRMQTPRPPGGTLMCMDALIPSIAREGVGGDLVHNVCVLHYVISAQTHKRYRLATKWRFCILHGVVYLP